MPVVVTYHSDVIRQRLLGAAVPAAGAAGLSAGPGDPDDQPRLPGRLAASCGPTATGWTSCRTASTWAPTWSRRPSDRDEADRLRAAHPGPLWVGCGRLVYYKGFLNAIRALTRVPGTLLIVGEGPDRPALEAEAARLGVRRPRGRSAGERARADRPTTSRPTPSGSPRTPAARRSGWCRSRRWPAAARSSTAAIPHSGVAWVSRHERDGPDRPDGRPGRPGRRRQPPRWPSRACATAWPPRRGRAIREFDHRVMAARSLAVYRRVLAERALARGRGLPVLAGGL